MAHQAHMSSEGAAAGISAERIAALVAACTAGSIALAPAPAMPANWFDDMIDATAAERLPAAMCAAVKNVHATGGAALRDARAGAMASALKQLHAATAAAEALVDPEARKLARTILCGQAAYLRYRQGNEDAAVALLHRGFRLDLVLERMGYTVLRMHRVQLLGNVLRLHARGGRPVEGLALGLRLLAWLEAGAPEILADMPYPWREGWDAGTAGIPPGLVQAMHAQIAAETVRVTTPSALAQALLALPTVTRTGQVGAWAALRRALDADSADEALSAAAALLSRDTLPSLPLWQDGAERTRTLIATRLGMLLPDRGRPARS